MRPRLPAATVAAAAVLAFAATAPAKAVTVLTDRADFEAALADAPLIRESFENNIETRPTIVFDGGLQSSTPVVLGNRVKFGVHQATPNRSLGSASMRSLRVRLACQPSSGPPQIETSLSRQVDYFALGTPLKHAADRHLHRGRGHRAPRNGSSALQRRGALSPGWRVNEG